MSTSATTGAPSPPALPQPSDSHPKAFVFSVGHTHVHYSSLFLQAVEAAMQLPSQSFRVHMKSIESKASESVLVTVAAVVEMANLLSSFNSMQTIYVEDEETTGLMLAYEVGKTEVRKSFSPSALPPNAGGLGGTAPQVMLRPSDKIIVFSDSALVRHVFRNTQRVFCIDLRQQQSGVFIDEQMKR